MSPWTQREMAKVAAEERAALGLGVMDALDPYLLAEEMGGLGVPDLHPERGRLPYRNS